MQVIVVMSLLAGWFSNILYFASYVAQTSTDQDISSSLKNSTVAWWTVRLFSGMQTLLTKYCVVVIHFSPALQLIGYLITLFCCCCCIVGIVVLHWARSAAAVNHTLVLLWYSPNCMVAESCSCGLMMRGEAYTSIILSCLCEEGSWHLASELSLCLHALMNSTTTVTCHYLSSVNTGAKLSCFMAERHKGANNFSKVVTIQCETRDVLAASRTQNNCIIV